MMSMRVVMRVQMIDDDNEGSYAVGLAISCWGATAPEE